MESRISFIRYTSETVSRTSLSLFLIAALFPALCAAEETSFRHVKVPDAKGKQIDAVLTFSDNRQAIDVQPAKGHRVLMQSFPGGIQSGTDYYMNSNGLLVTLFDRFRSTRLACFDLHFRWRLWFATVATWQPQAFDDPEDCRDHDERK